MSDDSAKAVGTLLILLVCLFLLVDCVGGKAEVREEVVRNRYIVPAHYTYSRYKGRTTSHYHPTEYHLLCDDWAGGHDIDCTVSAYCHVHEQQHIHVTVKIGCMTGWTYYLTYTGE